jgi:hypothetical protein
MAAVQPELRLRALITTTTTTTTTNKNNNNNLDCAARFIAASEDIITGLVVHMSIIRKYRGAEKSLARPSSL